MVSCTTFCQNTFEFSEGGIALIFRVALKSYYDSLDTDSPLLEFGKLKFEIEGKVDHILSKVKIKIGEINLDSILIAQGKKIPSNPSKLFDKDLSTINSVNYHDPLYIGDTLIFKYMTSLVSH